MNRRNLYIAGIVGTCLSFFLQRILSKKLHFPSQWGHDRYIFFNWCPCASDSTEIDFGTYVIKLKAHSILIHLFPVFVLVQYVKDNFCCSVLCIHHGLFLTVWYFSWNWWLFKENIASILLRTEHKSSWRKYFDRCKVGSQFGENHGVF